MAISFREPEKVRTYQSLGISTAVRERILDTLALATLALSCVAIGRSLSGASPLFGFGLALLPLLLFVVWKLASGHRSLILFFAVGVHMIPFTGVSVEPLRGPVHLSDLIVILAVGTWLLERFMTGRRTTLPRTPVIGAPLFLFGASLIPGIVEGHDRYGASFLGQPARLVLYAAIVTAFANVAAREAYKGIVAVFYAGTVLQSLAALYYMATGTSQTDAVNLSTGGTRVLALSTAMYLAAALVLALLNLQIDRRRTVLHSAIALLAFFGVIIAFGRTTYLAVGILVPIYAIALRRMRRAMAYALPILAPLGVIVALMLPSVAPDLVPTLVDRLNPSVERDTSYLWRERAIEVTLDASREDRLAGAGFGATRTFSLFRNTHQISGDPHNSFVYILSGGGVFALGAFSLLLVVYLLNALWRFRYSRGVDRALIAFSLSLFLIIVLNTLAGPVLTVPIFLLTFWIALLLPSLVKVEPVHGQRLRARIRGLRPRISAV